MVVTCPNCRSRYAVDPLKIGPAGRTVECARCHHQWHQKVEGEQPAPELVIRPITKGSGLPAVIPPKPAFRWGRVAIAVGVILLIAAAVLLYVFRAQLRTMTSEEARASAPAQVASGTTAPPARPAANEPPARPQIEVDLDKTSIEAVDGRFVVHGQLVNNGRAPGSTTLLRITFKRDEDVLGERSFPMVEGPLPPGGRTAFSQVIENPPAGTTDIEPSVE
jgi:predicted Zn finger-like uncharacterized protein